MEKELIDKKIDEAVEKNTQGLDNIVEVPISNNTSEVVKVELTGDIVKKLEENTFDVSVKRDAIEYIIPAKEFEISTIAKNLGVLEESLEDIKVDVEFSDVAREIVDQYTSEAKKNNATIVFPPVGFRIRAQRTNSDGSTEAVQINKFSSYVKRVLELPAGVDPNEVTTGIVFNADGSYNHIPTQVFELNNQWYAKLNSLTNSDYSVIWHPKTVASVENHWSKAAVNDLASRLVIFNPESFNPEEEITRGDFAEYIVRALGLYNKSANNDKIFTDVSIDEERSLAINLASDYGVVTGYPDGTFKSHATITREEAMVMYERAMKITELKGENPLRYKNYEDYNNVSEWAKASVEGVLSAGVFNGTSEETIEPKATFTYAEAAQAIKNLLVASNLINE